MDIKVDNVKGTDEGAEEDSMIRRTDDVTALLETKLKRARHRSHSAGQVLEFEASRVVELSRCRGWRREFMFGEKQLAWPSDRRQELAPVRVRPLPSYLSSRH